MQFNELINKSLSNIRKNSFFHHELLTQLYNIDNNIVLVIFKLIELPSVRKIQILFQQVLYAPQNIYL